MHCIRLTFWVGNKGKVILTLLTKQLKARYCVHNLRAYGWSVGKRVTFFSTRAIFFPHKSVFLKVWHALKSPGRFTKTQIAEPHPVCQFIGLGGGTRIWISNKFPGDVDPAGPGSTLENDSLRSYPLKSRTKAHERDSSEPSLRLWLSYHTQLITMESQAVQFHCRRLFPSSLKSKTNSH